MSIFDDVVVNARSAADVIGKKATKLADSTKLAISAADLKAEISKKSEILGRVVYVSRVSGKSYEKSISELVETITSLKEQLEAVETQLADAKSRKKCPVCGMANSRTAVFCNRCGEKIGEPQASDMPEPDAEAEAEVEAAEACEAAAVEAAVMQPDAEDDITVAVAPETETKVVAEDAESKADDEA